MPCVKNKKCPWVKGWYGKPWRLEDYIFSYCFIILSQNSYNNIITMSIFILLEDFHHVRDFVYLIGGTAEQKRLGTTESTMKIATCTCIQGMKTSKMQTFRHFRHYNWFLLSSETKTLLDTIFPSAIHFLLHAAHNSDYELDICSSSNITEKMACPSPSK